MNAYRNPKDIEITSLHVVIGVFDGVSYSTLNYRFKKGDDTRTLANNGGHNIKLNKAQEASLIWYVDIAIERSFPIRYDMIIAAATIILTFSMAVFKRIGKNWAR